MFAAQIMPYPVARTKPIYPAAESGLILLPSQGNTCHSSLT
ncbi:MAG: hypothetical protein AVDCRST_MAG18-492 [uncultured Thermomicrobiales bacterium]|uniref:Uncharacterized protein n=1 Tax=uncultured Thermomicrobiales bacterium TaxID=1645740 RepID=A0A6J4UKH8_9BACT|nr:MAG: hypothetical protein AVDCRST_MAG18-492 [uncultured Thermomicrobiales bacterium]